MTAPLAAGAPWSPQTFATRMVTCPMCAGCGELVRVINLRFEQDERYIRCTGCAGSGEVEVNVAEVDGETFAWCEALRLLAAVDEGELESGDWQSSWPADRLNFRDRYLLSELGARL